MAVSISPGTPRVHLRWPHCPHTCGARDSAALRPPEGPPLLTLSHNSTSPVESSSLVEWLQFYFYFTLSVRCSLIHRLFITSLLHYFITSLLHYFITLFYFDFYFTLSVRCSLFGTEWSLPLQQKNAVFSNRKPNLLDRRVCWRGGSRRKDLKGYHPCHRVSHSTCRFTFRQRTPVHQWPPSSLILRHRLLLRFAEMRLEKTHLSFNERGPWEQTVSFVPGDHIHNGTAIELEQYRLYRLPPTLPANDLDNLVIPNIRSNLFQSAACFTMSTIVEDRTDSSKVILRCIVRRLSPPSVSLRAHQVLFQRLRLARLLHEQIQIGFFPTYPFKELQSKTATDHHPVISHHASQRERLLHEATKETVNP
jgi:hypothetical protein